MRRIISVQLPHWSIDRWIRSRLLPGKDIPPDPDQIPFALTETVANAQRLTALSPAAERIGLVIGQSVADARAIVPELVLYPAEPEDDKKALASLARWMVRYSPLTNTDPAPRGAQDQTSGLLIDATGCSHFFGSEVRMLKDIQTRLQRAGITSQIALAPTPMGARALARYASGTVAEDGEHMQRLLAPLPITALRLDRTSSARLVRLGLKHVGSVSSLPRTSLSRRFRGHPAKFVSDLLLSLDKTLGHVGDPFSPLLPLPDWRITKAFADPLMDTEQLMTVVRDGLTDLLTELQAQHQAVKRVTLDLLAVDGGHVQKHLKAGVATTNLAHLMRLADEILKDIELGFGLDGLILSASIRETRSPQDQAHTALAPNAEQDAEKRAAALGALLDRLTVRLGSSAVQRMAYRPGHMPERQHAPVSADKTNLNWDAARVQAASRPPRPLKLLMRPEAVDVIAALPEGLPLQFRWRRVLHKLGRAEGPERIASAWWTGEDENTRDYYRVETEAGERFWLFRDGLYQIPGVRSADGSQPRWFLHGLFA